MKTCFTLIIGLFFCLMAHSQTWNGSAGTDWFTAANWTPATVPTAASNVTIPGALANYPLLTADASAAKFTMTTGSQLHLNGHTLNSNGALNIQTATIDGGGSLSSIVNGSASVENSSITATLALSEITSSFSFYNNTVNGDANLATASSSTTSSNYMHRNMIVGNLTLTHAGSGTFYEAHNSGGDTITGNVIMNVTGTGTFYSGYSNPIIVGGNYTLNRTANGTTNIFYSGNQHCVGGNFSFTSSGGNTQIGNGYYTTTVGGTFNLNAGAGNFELYRMKNEASGGTVAVANPGSLNFERDTLKAGVTISGSNGYNSFYGNNITGDVDFATSATNSGSANYMHLNTIVGNLILTYAGSGQFKEAYDAGRDSITGNATINVTGTGIFYSGYSNPIKVGGDYTLNRTANGATNVFTSGNEHSVGGNFSFTSSGGNTQIGNGYYTTPVGGTFNLSQGSGVFELYRIKNETSGGTATINDPGSLTLQQDTLLADMMITGCTGFTALNRNNITGDVTLATAITSTTNSNYMDLNTIIGNFSLTHAGSGLYYSGYNAGQDTISGNMTVTIPGTGIFYSGYANAIKVGGNYTLNRTTNGTTKIFTSGSKHSVGGNFSFTSSGGPSQIGNGYYTTPVAGTFNVNQGPGSFDLYAIRNETAGGTVTITSPNSLAIARDTLLADININGSISDNSLYGNQVTGDVSLATSALSTTNSNYVEHNTILGNLALTHAGSGIFYEAYNGGRDSVSGNLTIQISGTGTFYSGYSNPVNVGGNYTLNRTVPGSTNIFSSGTQHGVGGNFTFNTIGGATQIGNLSFNTPVGGMFNLTGGFASPFAIYRINNATAGGTVTITAPSSLTIQKDTLQSDLVVSNSSGYNSLNGNLIQGNLFFETSVTNTVSSYMDANSIMGDLTLIHQGTGYFYESYNGGSDYVSGTDSLVNAGTGTLIIGYAYPHLAGGNIRKNTVSGSLELKSLNVTDNDSSDIKNYGIQPFHVISLNINRSGKVPIILKTPLTVTNGLTFTSGYLKSSVSNPFVFSNNAGYSGGGNASHIIGVIERTGTTAFTFPFGNGLYYSPIGITAPGSGTHTFRAQYIHNSVANDGYDTTALAAGLDHLNHTEYWKLDRLAGTGDVAVTLSWGGNSGTVNDPADLRVAHWNGSQWENDGNNATTGTLSAGTLQSVAALPTFGPLTLASVSESNPLPLNLVNFGAYRVKKGENRIEWQTVSEDPNTIFAVQKSTDGKNFVILELIAGKSLNGSYYFVPDRNLYRTENFYRLKAAAPGAAEVFSPVVRVLNEGNTAGISITPNPAYDHITIRTLNEQLHGTYAVVLDMQGRVMRRFLLEPQLVISIVGWPAGVYTIRFADGKTQRMVKQ